MFETIRYDVDAGIATLTLAVPERLNAVSGRMIAEIVDALDLADRDDAVRAVIVTGDGRAFCAGADLSRGAATFTGRPEPAAGDDANPADEASRDMGGILALRLFDMLKPVIGAINGPAVGLGATMTLPMDIRLASEGARFGFVFARRGMVPEATSSFFLPRIVGIGRALEWTYSGRLVDAGEALAAGLVASVHPPAALLAAARAIATEIAVDAAPVSVALTRQMMWRGLTMTHPMDAHRVESVALIARGGTADAAEGVASFLEKRAPAFPDRVSTDMPGFFPWWRDPPYEG